MMRKNYIYIVTALIGAVVLGSCASKPPSSKVLKLAKPIEVKAPDVGAVKTQIGKSNRAVANAARANDSASRVAIELRRDVVDLKDINQRFSWHIERLEKKSVEEAKTFELLREEYVTVIDGLETRGLKLAEDLASAQDSLVTARDLLVTSEKDAVKLEGEISASQAEVVKYREDREAMIDAVKDHEKATKKAQAEADANKGYKTIFWRFVVGFVVLILVSGALAYFKPPFVGRIFKR